jgi:C_GCAxxG_C_C family probable redox protein
MTDSERIETAANYKATGQYNCAQSVLKVFQDKIGLTDEQITELGSGFAAGMGGMESTCGALIGASMVAGFLTKGNRTPAMTRQILEKFKQKSGATLCKELKGAGTGKVLCECPDCVRNAISSMLEVTEA